MNLNEATHTYASYSFAAYCEEVANQKRNKYFSECFNEEDREAAFGPNNGCDTCQGTGWVPVSKDDMNDPYRHLWVQAELDTPSEDGFHLVPCQKCSPVKDGLDEHIVKQGSKFTLKSKKTGKSLGSYDSKAGAEKREKQVEYFKHVNEETDNPNYRQTQRKIDTEKRANTGHDDGDGKSAADKNDSAAQRKEKSVQRRKQKEKDRESKKLMPYEYASQKEADRAASHLGVHGSHTTGNGIYKPGSSEYSLRDAVHRKKEKQKMKGGRAQFHREEAEGLSTGMGIANPEQVLGVVKRIVKDE